MKFLSFTLVALLSIASTAFAQPEPLEGFPITWRSGSDDTTFDEASVQDSGPVVFDLNADGIQDVIVTGRKDVWVFDISHTSEENPLYHWQAEENYEFCGIVAVAHLSADGNPWIVTGGSRLHHYGAGDCPANALCRHADGDCYHWASKIHAWKMTEEGWESHIDAGELERSLRLTTPAVGDLDGDGLDELAFVGSRSYGIFDYGFNGTFLNASVIPAFYKYDPLTNSFVAGDVLVDVGECFGDGFTYERPASQNNYQIAQTIPSIGDVNGDGVADVVTQCLQVIEAFSFAEGFQNGEQLWEHEFFDFEVERGWDMPTNTTFIDGDAYVVDEWDFQLSDRNRCSGPLLADLDGDGALEIYVATAPTITNEPHRIWHLDGETGDLLPTSYDFIPVGANGQELAPLGEMAVADPSNEGGAKLYAGLPVFFTTQDHDTSWLRVRGWNGGLLPENEPFPYNRSDETGNPLQNSFDAHSPAILPMENGSGLAIYLTERDALMRFSIQQQSDTVWPITGVGSPYHEIRSSITIADLDRDGLWELITTGRISREESKLHALETTLPYSAEQVEWSGYRNGPKHTGLYAQPVSGHCPLPYTVWEGRIIVHGVFNVLGNETLEIKPGTVVEFRPGAKLKVYGTLIAEGTEHDSIYFKPDGTMPWWGIHLFQADDAVLDYCVIHGCSTGVFVQSSIEDSIAHSRIYDVITYGINVLHAAHELRLVCNENDISGGLYGINGSTSSGQFVGNEIHDCARAGIYWYGDDGAVSPFFAENIIRDCGSGEAAIAGGYFNSTTARLECNQFIDNLPNQLYCQLNGNIVLNDDFGGRGMNVFLSNEPSTLCESCGQPSCVCYGQDFRPLVWLWNSLPQFSHGQNNFIFEEDGTFIHDDDLSAYPVCPGSRIPLTENYYAINLDDRADPPAPGNFHFCPDQSFVDTEPLQSGTTCVLDLPEGLTEAELLYQSAAQSEDAGNYGQAQELFADVTTQYPESPEAIWATRGYLRTGLANQGSAMQQHDSLQAIWLNESLPVELRCAARREAVWALLAGEEWGTARYELEPIVEAVGDPDSLWAVITLELITLLEEGNLESLGNEQAMQSRLANFHDRLHQLMGRMTDEEVLAQETVPQKHQLAEAYPNPFNSTVTIKFDIPDAGAAKIEIFNLLGQKVTTLLDQPMTTGTFTKQWVADAVPSGVYFYRFSTHQHVETHKLLLLK